MQLTHQDILESQHYNVATFGLHHRTTLSTPILVRVIRDLICNDFFAHHSSRSQFDLELHLRCIVASLRLLQAHGIQAGSGTLTYAFFDELYNRMTWWQNYHSGQVQGATGTEDKIKNYNNEFLIVYARDLIVTLPSDRSVATNVATRIIAAATTLGHAVTPKFSLMKVWEERGTSCAGVENDCSVQTSSIFLAFQVPHYG